MQNWLARPFLIFVATRFSRAFTTKTVTSDTLHNNGAGRSSIASRGTSRESGGGSLGLAVAFGAINSFTGLANRAKLLKSSVTLGAVILVYGHFYLSTNYFTPDLIQSQPDKRTGKFIRLLTVLPFLNSDSGFRCLLFGLFQQLSWTETIGIKGFTDLLYNIDYKPATEFTRRHKRY